LHLFYNRANLLAAKEFRGEFFYSIACYNSAMFRLLLLALLLTACASAPVIPAPTLPPPSATPVQSTSTSAPSPTPTLIPTATPLPHLMYPYTIAGLRERRYTGGIITLETRLGLN